MVEWDADLYLKNNNGVTPLQAAKQRCKQVFMDINDMLKRKKLREKEERERAENAGFAKQQAHRLAKWEEEEEHGGRADTRSPTTGSESEEEEEMVLQEPASGQNAQQDDALALFISQAQGAAAGSNGKPTSIYSTPTTFQDQEGKVGSSRHKHIVFSRSRH
jgi:hypothetical protein